MSLTIRTVRGILKRKVNEWLASIDDEQLRQDLHSKVIVTGGCIVSMLTGVPVNDYDVYLKDKDAVVRLTGYYLKQFAANPPPGFKTGGQVKMWVDHEASAPNGRVHIMIRSTGVAGEQGDKNTYEYFETVPDPDAAANYVDAVVPDHETAAIISSVIDAEAMGAPNPENAQYVALAAAVHKDIDAPPHKGRGADKKTYRPVFMTDNAITLADEIQLCIRFYGDVAEIHENFDFDHCKCSYDHGSGELHTPNEAVMAILTKELRYSGSLYPIASIIRTRKFIKRGWSCNAGQYIKMVSQVNKLDLDNLEVWTDQLTGVDTAYFQELISALKHAKEQGAVVDCNYVVMLIDKLF